MNKVLQCAINAAIGGAVAFFPTLTMVRTNSAFAAAQEILAPETSEVAELAAEETSVVNEPTPESTSQTATEEVAAAKPAKKAASTKTSKAAKATKTTAKTAAKPKSTAKICAYRIVIKSLNIENCIQDHAAHDLSTPGKSSGKVANISVGSSRFIYGHNSANIFGQLGKIQNGAVIEVVTPSKTEKYRVSLAKSSKNFDYRCLYAGNTNRISGVKAYRAANCAQIISMASLVYGQTDSLALMTCAGSYESALKTYDHRHIIIAEKL